MPEKFAARDLRGMMTASRIVDAGVLASALARNMTFSVEVFTLSQGRSLSNVGDHWGLHCFNLLQGGQGMLARMPLLAKPSFLRKKRCSRLWVHLH